MQHDVRIAPIIASLFAVDIGLGALFLGNYFLGEPYWPVTQIVSFRGENTLSAWYSSLQLGLLAGLLALLAHRARSLALPRRCALIAFTCLVLAMSADESVLIHERLGKALTAAIAGDGAVPVYAARSGYWTYVLGLPAALGLGAVLWLASDAFRAAPGALVKLGGGLALLMLGAVGMESLWNFLRDPLLAEVVEPWLEESLEKIGVTVMIWGVLQRLAVGLVPLLLTGGRPLSPADGGP
ncbi:MAG: hypothetical protein D6782_05595 [Alphaproteobacteria bacterium]|nr:MAG: hypothetical protein D6782_05595 [Alphaproteobacteria bacterium]